MNESIDLWILGDAILIVALMSKLDEVLVNEFSVTLKDVGAHPEQLLGQFGNLW